MDPRQDTTHSAIYDECFQDIVLQTDSAQYYDEQIDQFLNLVPLQATIFIDDDEIFEIFEDFVNFPSYNETFNYGDIVAEAMLEEYDQIEFKTCPTQQAVFDDKNDETQHIEIKQEVLDKETSPLSINSPEKHLYDAHSAKQTTLAGQTPPPSELDPPDEVKPKKKKTGKPRKKPGNKPPKARMQYQHSSYACEPCGRTFGGRRGLTQHNNVHHSGPREHRCRVCGKRFHTSEDLEKHERRHEALSKPFKCDECPREFFYRHDLDRHVSFHHGEARYACKVCGKRMARMDQMIIHETSHVNNTVRMRKKKIGADRFLDLD